MVSFRGFLKWLRTREDEKILHSLAIGINSTVDYTDDKHIILLDYDFKDLKRVIASIRECQNFWNLSDFFIFSTKHGYHAIAFYDFVPYTRLKMIIDYAEGIDPMFRYISKYYTHRTLRTIGKYKKKDIKFKTLIVGVRKPTKKEFEIGELKRKEHMYMIGCPY
jgi:hypothetical protein